MNQTLRPRRIVVKVGTSTLAHHAGGPNLHNIELLARTLSDLKCAGHQIVLVSSGAIAIGSYKLGMPSRPTELRAKQAAASVGQSELMHLYDKFFSEYGQTVGQILLNAGRRGGPEPGGQSARHLFYSARDGRGARGQRKRLGLLRGNRNGAA
jgi:glutamate 5-kinase